MHVTIVDIGCHHAIMPWGIKMSLYVSGVTCMPRLNTVEHFYSITIIKATSIRVRTVLLVVVATQGNKRAKHPQNHITNEHRSLNTLCVTSGAYI